MDNPPRPGYAAGMDHDDEIDAIGLLCPLPVLRARKKLMAMRPGEVLRVLASDPAAVIDMPHFCAQAGHRILATEEAADHRIWLIQRGQ